MIVYEVKKELKDTLILLTQKLNRDDYIKVVSVMSLLHMGVTLGLGEHPTELSMVAKDIYDKYKHKKPNAKVVKLVKK